jgi:hypothetical protein
MKSVNFRAVEVLDELPAMETLAVELATLAGREIVAAFGTIFMVRYKTGARDAISLRDPVSDIDRWVEVVIRERLATHFPNHGVIGEELAERPGRESDFVWAIDPIDGTTNFVDGSAVHSVDRYSPSGPRGRGRGLVLGQPRSSCRRLSRKRQREASLRWGRRDADVSCPRRVHGALRSC